WIGGGARGLDAGLREIIATKGVLALMADQHPGKPETGGSLALWGKVTVPYPARLLRFLAERDFLFVPVSTRLEADGGSTFLFHPAWDFRADSADSKTSPADLKTSPAGLEAALADRVRGFLEEAISAAPDQWNWSYPKITPQ
ncbi:MAG: Bacterial lipid biosynthesis acyltransferase, partial [Verrucomicrobiales bacterium]|nr:Bacterial lipid biosynthesis acyltransferase [Verrucomicrobiales bacterium]